MNETKRIINDYEIIQSFYVGEKEVVVGENKNSEYRYICGYYESNEIFERINDCRASNDYLDIMTLFCDRAKEQVELCKQTQKTEIGIITPDMYSPVDIYDDLTGKVVVEKIDNLRREYQNAENQLFYVTGGNGAKPNARGTKVSVIPLQAKSIAISAAMMWKALSIKQHCPNGQKQTLPT